MRPFFFSVIILCSLLLSGCIYGSEGLIQVSPEKQRMLTKQDMLKTAGEPRRREIILKDGEVLEEITWYYRDSWRDFWAGFALKPQERTAVVMRFDSHGNPVYYKRVTGQEALALYHRRNEE